MSYKSLEIWKLSKRIIIEIQDMTLSQFPKYEMYEEGAQIRRSIKSVRSNIVEGYGRRRYKKDFIKFLINAHASCNESLDHLEILYETKSLKNENLYKHLHTKIDRLGAAINGFIMSVDKAHLSVK
jgi:four helix bundle protein